MNIVWCLCRPCDLPTSSAVHDSVHGAQVAGAAGRRLEQREEGEGAERPLHHGVQRLRPHAVLQRDQRTQDSRREERLQGHLHQRTVRLYRHRNHYSTSESSSGCVSLGLLKVQYILVIIYHPFLVDAL